MQVSVVIPVYNEERVLAQTIGRLKVFLDTHFPTDHEVVIANNASTDRTLEIAYHLATTHKGVTVLHLDQKGRGGAVKCAWSRSEADILSYMDVDLSADLSEFPALIQSLASGKHDVATGSRLLKPELTNRSFRRETISRAYNLLVKAFFGTEFSDAQCGFKAITRTAAAELLPLIVDNEWFFDTELLVVAEKLGYRLFDLPVRWVEDPDSRVKLVRTAWQDLRGLILLRRKLASGELFQNFALRPSSGS